MPPKTQQNKGGYNNDGKFAQVTLTAADKIKFLAWLKAEAPDEIEAEKWLCDDSYRVSSKFDYNANCYMVTLTQQDAKHINANVIITSRSTDLSEAKLLSLYKVAVMFQNQRLPTDTAEENWG